MKVNVKRKLKILLTIALLIVLFFGICKYIIPSLSIAVDQADLVIQSKLDKYINYNLSEEDKGTLVQYVLSTELNYKDDSEKYPIKESQLNIDLNAIDGKYPSDAKVIVKELDDNSYNYTYDQEKGKIVLTTNSSKNGLNYLLLCYYDTYIEDNAERELSFNVDAKIGLESEDNIVINKEELFEAKASENVGNLTSLSYETDDIYNGYIKSNIINGTSYDTNYNEKMKLTISKKEAQEVLDVTASNKNTVYTSSTFSKDNITKILGENGEINIYNIEGNIIAKINKDSEFDENGNLSINYNDGIDTIIIKTSKVQNEGILQINNTKTIKSTYRDLENEKIETTTEVKGLREVVVSEEDMMNVLNGTAIEENIENNEMFNYKEEKVEEIKDATTNVTIDVDNTKWTNRQQNDVTFTANLNSDSISKNLFKEPTIKIELPAEVEKVVLGNTSATYTNGLELQNPTVEDNNGKLSIVAKLSGQQKEYSQNELGLSAELKIPATIIVKNDIESTNSNINVIYTNNYTLNGTQEVGNKETEVKIENFKEENIDNNNNQNVNTAINSVNLSTPENVSDALKVEVTPVRGDVTLNNGDTVYEGEFIKYNVTITNTSNEDIDNVRFVGTVPEGTVYGEVEANYNKNLDYSYYKYNESLTEKPIVVGKVEAGKSVTKNYEVQVKDLSDSETEKQITSNIKTYIGNAEINNYEVTNIIKNAEYKVFLSAGVQNVKNTFNYKFKIEGNSDEKVKFALNLPEGSKVNYVVPIREGEYADPSEVISGDSISSIDGKLILNLKPEQYIAQIVINNDNKTSEELKSVATVNDKYKSNENTIFVEYENITLTMTSKTEGEEVKYEDEINYEIKLKMDQKSNAEGKEFEYKSVNLTDYLPEEIEPISVTYTKFTLSDELEVIKGEEVTENISTIITDKDGNREPNINLDLLLPYQEEVVVKLKARAGYVDEKTKVSNSTTAVSIESSDNNENTILASSNVVTHTILPADYQENKAENSENQQNPNDGKNGENGTNSNGQNNGNGTFTISGIAWNDENGDGARNSSESLIGGMETLLVNSETSETKSTTTSGNGTYTFSGINQGKYIVVFKYDTNKYHTTEYQKAGVDTNSNSKAIQKTITLQGNEQLVGATDIINLDSNISNINIGLVENKIFDLKLDKYVTKVTVQTQNGTRQLNYDGQKIAKTEIRAKEIEGALVIVEYKIVVTNEGELAGRVNKIVDYLPQELTFSSELNKSWAQGTDGSLTNNSLANKELRPGESVTLTLVATKKMTLNSTGTFTNGAELLDVTNASNIKDRDSISGNKVQSEDDYSKADLIVSVSTGAVWYVSIAIITVIALAVFAFLCIKFNWLDKINIKKASMFILVGAIIIMQSYNSVYATQAKWRPEGPNFSPTNGQSSSFSDINGNYAYECNGDGLYATAKKYNEYPFSHISNYSKEELPGSEKKIDKINVDIEKDNIDEKIKIKTKDTNYVIGPFTIVNKDENDKEVYKFELYDKKGNVLEKVYTCDENGIDIRVDGSMRFYIKVPKENCREGLVRLKVVANRTKSGVEKYKEKGIAYYNAPAGGWQPIKSARPIENEVSNPWEVTGSDSVTWLVPEGTGDLEVIKTTAEGEVLKIEGVEFTVKNNSGEYVVASESEGTYAAIDYVTDEAQATIFKTDSNGRFLIKDLVVGEYTAIEKSMPDSHYSLDGSGKTEIVKLNIDNNAADQIKYPNKQINIDLSGYVWVDETIDEGKINDRNNLKSTNKHPEISNYVDGKDFLLPDIPVKLMRKGQTTPIATQRTNNDGAYKFTNIPLYDDADTEKKNVILDQYYIEFEYNGLVFTNVLPYNDNKVKPYLDSEESNGSKASEAQEVRDNFNKDFSVIEGGTSKDTGITRDSNGNKKYDLTYSADISNHTSEIVTDKDQFPITANTTNTGYNIKDYYKEGITEIKYINLGLYKREKPDISLMKDLQNVKVSINGYNHIYEKGLKRADNQNGEEFNITAKFGNKYGKTKYKQAIYREDYNYKDEANADNNLKVYAIYKIDLMNENTDLQVEVNSVVDYFDSKYSIDKIGTELNNGEVKDNNLSLEGNETTYNDQYKKAIINTKSIGRLDNTTPTRTIYVQYELNKEKILDLFKDKTELEYENVAEINSYSVFKDNKVYAGIDKDSNPGSVTPEDNDTKASYQDDTDWAPGLVLQIASARTMAGKVFVDDVIKQDGYNDSSATMIGKERIGNGIYDNGEAGVPGVKVTLTSDKMTYISESVNEKAKYKVTTTYHKGSETGDVISEDEIKKNGVPEGSVAIVKYEKTEGNDGIELDVGEYIISEFIPGNYTLTYTWGDKTYTVQDYKGTIYNSSRDQNDVSWYKKDVDTRYSDAIDNYNTNQDAPKGSRIQIDEDANNGITDRTKMDSTTPKMDITIEITDTATTTYNDSFVPKDYNIKNIDFGIVERPRQKLDIDKRIKAFKVILGNEESGQVIVDATVEPKKDVLGNIQRDANGDIIYEITGQKNYTTYMYPSQFTNPTKGQLKLELDSELMQNSIVKVEYEIVVANNSELEYKTEGYYKYGTDKTNIVNIKPSGVYDYMDNTLALDKQHESENSNWEIVATKYDETTDLGPESIVEKYFTENYSYVDENENQVSVSKWELSSKRYQELYTNWIESIQEKKVDADQIRQIKLNNKIILHNSNLEKELAPGESSTAQLYASKSLANMDEIVLNNDAEITQTRSSSNYGRKITPIDSYLYDSGEEIIIIPPTGESKNYLPYAIIGVTALAILGVGVILIKKKAIGNDGKED